MEKDSARAAIQPRLKILAQFEKPGKRAEKWEKISCNRNRISARAEKRAWTCAIMILFSGKQDDCRYEGEAIKREARILFVVSQIPKLRWNIRTSSSMLSANSASLKISSLSMQVCISG